MSKRKRVVMSWSGGKDSSLALRDLLGRTDVEVVELLTTVAETFDRISHHGVRSELLQRQTESIGIPLRKVMIPGPCTNDVYERVMGEEMARYLELGVSAVCFGDIFLQDLRDYREAKLAGVGMTAMFPLWKRDTKELALAFIESGFRAFLSCVDGTKLTREFAGRAIDADLIKDLPVDVDPCGENGEFHSFVYDGPIFQTPVAVRVGETIKRDTRYFTDLVFAGDGELERRGARESLPIPTISKKN